MSRYWKTSEVKALHELQKLKPEWCVEYGGNRASISFNTAKAFRAFLREVAEGDEDLIEKIATPATETESMWRYAVIVARDLSVTYQVRILPTDIGLLLGMVNAYNTGNGVG